MAKMQAIEITNSEYTILMLYFAIIQAAYDLHGYRKDPKSSTLLKPHILPVSVILRNQAELSAVISHHQSAGLPAGKMFTMLMP